MEEEKRGHWECAQQRPSVQIQAGLALALRAMNALERKVSFKWDDEKSLTTGSHQVVLVSPWYFISTPVAVK